MTLTAIPSETRAVRVPTIALAAMLAASGCTSRAPSAPIAYESRVRCTADKVNCVDACMPNVEWAVIPGFGWVYVPGSEYLCQSHCDRAEDACLASAVGTVSN